jgi:hypothetical protein
MGDVLRMNRTGQLLSARTLLQPYPMACSLDQQGSKNVSQDTEPTHWKPAVISSQWCAHDKEEKP